MDFYKLPKDILINKIHTIYYISRKAHEKEIIDYLASNGMFQQGILRNTLKLDKLREYFVSYEKYDKLSENSRLWKFPKDILIKIMIIICDDVKQDFGLIDYLLTNKIIIIKSLRQPLDPNKKKIFDHLTSNGYIKHELEPDRCDYIMMRGRDKGNRCSCKVLNDFSYDANRFCNQCLKKINVRNLFEEERKILHLLNIN